MINILQKNFLKILPLLLLLNSGCGSGLAQKKHVIDPEFLQLVDLFELEQEVIVDIDIEFKKIDYPTVGLCFYSVGLDNKKHGLNIQIDPDFWNKSSNEQREELLFHELGHCILGRDHIETMLKYNTPKSVMYPYVFESAYKKHREYYVNELKNPKVLLTDYL